MKRKQKLPRRTRRQSSQKTSDHTEDYGDLIDVAEKRLINTEQSSKIPMNNLHNNTEKAGEFHKIKEFKDTIGVGSKQCFHPQNVSLIHLEDNKEGHQKSKMNANNCIAQPAKDLKSFSNSSENFNGEKSMRNLKRPCESLVQSMDVPNKPTAFVNFQNQSGKGNMPIILNVFTLSQDPTSYIKRKPINKIRENNFPVTPPCSPPLKRVQFTGTQNVSSSGEIKTICSTHPFLNESTMESKTYNIYSPVRHDQGNVNNGSLLILPDATNQLMDQRKYAVEDRTTRYDINCVEKFQYFQAKENNNVIHSGKRSVPNPSYSGAQTNPESKKYALNDSHVFLSPREVKVLELKRRLQEQEAALKKLRSKH